MSNYDSKLNTIYAALADPTRRAIIERLSRSNATVSELAETHNMALPSFMAHLKKLETAMLITSAKSGRVRTYSLVAETFAPAQHWLDAQRALWRTQLDQFDDYAIQLHQRKNKL